MSSHEILLCSFRNSNVTLILGVCTAIRNEIWKFFYVKSYLFYRYLHMWAWLIMDYTTSEENGHWKCKLTSDMFLCGERKNRNLTLFCIPNFVMKCLTCLFGSKEYPDDGSGESSNSSCCKKCTYISSVFLVPLALVLGVLGKIFFYQVMFSRKFSWIPICRHRNRQLHFYNINVFAKN